MLICELGNTTNQDSPAKMVKVYYHKRKHGKFDIFNVTDNMRLNGVPLTTVEA
jgi:hypothetical protein